MLLKESGVVHPYEKVYLAFSRGCNAFNAVSRQIRSPIESLGVICNDRNRSDSSYDLIELSVYGGNFN